MLELTGGRGADLTLEVGGADTLARTLLATRPGGEISLIGVLSGIEGKLNLGPVLHRSLNLHGIYVGSRAIFAAMNQAVAANRMRPIVDRAFSFAETAEAFRHFASGRHFGKVIIRID